MILCEVAKSEVADSQLVEWTNMSNRQIHRTDELAKSQLMELGMFPLPEMQGLGGGNILWVGLVVLG